MNRPSQAPRTRVALAISVVLLTLTIGVTLSRSPAVVARSNRINTAVEFATVTGRYAACQGNEVLPQGTTAIRLSLDSVLGPKVKVRVLQGQHLLSYGERGAGWTAADITVPVKPVAQTVRDVSVCFAFSAQDESVGLTGEPVAGVQPSHRGAGLIRVEYLQPGERSWWSLASTIATHMAFGHAWSGHWVVLFLAGAMAGIALIVAAVAVGLGR